MFEASVNWAAIALPIFLAALGVWVSIETPRLDSPQTRRRWRIGLCAFGVIASAVVWVQQRNARTELESTRTDRAEFRTKLDAIADAVKIDRNAPIGTLTNEILRRLEKIENPPRNPIGIYKNGDLVGRGIGGELHANIMKFSAIETNVPLTPGDIFEFGNYKLRYVKADISSVGSFPGGMGGATYTNATTEVVSEINK